jgi:hypothetical protein
VRGRGRLKCGSHGPAAWAGQGVSDGMPGRCRLTSGATTRMGPLVSGVEQAQARARMCADGRGPLGGDSERSGRSLALRVVRTHGTRGSTGQRSREGKEEGEERLPSGPWLSGLSSTPSRAHDRPCPTRRRPTPRRAVYGQGCGVTRQHGRGGGRKKGGERME